MGEDCHLSPHDLAVHEDFCRNVLPLVPSSFRWIVSRSFAGWLWYGFYEQIQSIKS